VRCSANNWYQSKKILAAYGGDSAMLLKPTVDSMRGGGRQRKAKVICGVMPLEARRGAVPRGGDDNASGNSRPMPLKLATVVQSHCVAVQDSAVRPRWGIA
jgi:hypothetical protein